MIGHLEQHPAFNNILQHILAQSPMQRNRIETFIETQGPDYWLLADMISEAIAQLMETKAYNITYIASAYQRMCKDLLKEQIRFRKTGVFHEGSMKEVYESVYSQEEVMHYYLLGLLLSYLFWPNHYEIFAFFKKNISALSVESHLEVGAGHGLFTAGVRRQFPQSITQVIDISQTAINLSEEILPCFAVNTGNIEFLHSNFLTSNLGQKSFDLIVMGEVLEHVDDPQLFLQKAWNISNDNSTFYLSTCVNAPAIDHIYHFKTIEEIRDLIADCGFIIKQEMVLPTENTPEDEWYEKLIPINYAATCSKA